MSNGQTIEDLKKMLDSLHDDRLPDDISRKLLAIMIATNADAIKKVTISLENNHKELINLVKNLDERFLEHLKIGEDFRGDVYKEIDDIKRNNIENPTIPVWIKRHPKKALFIAFITFLLSNIWFISGVRYLITLGILHFFGLPQEVINQIMLTLFS